MKLDLEYQSETGRVTHEYDVSVQPTAKIGAMFRDERVVQVETTFRNGSTSKWTRSENRDG